MSTQISRERLAQLARVPMFVTLSERDLAVVDELVDDIEVDPGEVLTHEGRPGRDSFVILSGRAKAVVEERVVAELGPGQVFGEIASQSAPHLHAATVAAITAMRLLVIEAQNLAALVAVRDIPTQERGTARDRVQG